MRDDARAVVAAGAGDAADVRGHAKREAAVTARAADADIDAAGAGAGEACPAGDVEAAVAAAAAQRLGDDAGAEILLRERGDARQIAGRRAVVDVEQHDAGIAAPAAAATHAEADLTGTSTCRSDPAGDVEPAGAAAAAERLGDDAVGKVAVGRRSRRPG